MSYEPKKSRQNVAHHYDLDDRLYDLFLDPWRQYSCAYFPDETIGLVVRQWPQEDAVHDAEDRGRGTDAEGQGQNGHERGTRVAADLAQGIA